MIPTVLMNTGALRHPLAVMALLASCLLAAAGLKSVKGVTLDGCAHWIFEENPDETLPVIIDFLGAH